MNINPKNVNAACQHPERYTARTPKSTEDQVIDLLWGAASAARVDFVLETGTHTGATSLRLAQAFQRWGCGHLDTIEANERHASEAKALLEGLPATVHLADANEWLPPPGREYGLAFFDTDDKGNLAGQFERFWRAGSLPAGAIVAFHDTGSAWPTRRTLEPLEADGVLSLVAFATPRGVSIGEVKRGPNV